MAIIPTLQQAFDITRIDTTFSKTMQGYVYAVTTKCKLTTFVSIIPVPNKYAVTIAESIMEHFILVYGPMEEIRTEQRSTKMRYSRNKQIIIKKKDSDCS